MTQLPDLKTARIGAILNTSSGSCDAQAETGVQDCLKAAGITPHRIWCGLGADVERSIEEAKAEALDVLIVIGGDGTIRSAAQHFGADGPLLLPLPGGTMNMLPRTLYGERSWRDALRDTLADPKVQSVHGGEVGGHRFFVAALFGEPTRFAEAREAVRDGDLVGAVGKGVTAFQQAMAHEIRYSFGADPQASAEAIAVMCPLTSAALSDDEDVLEAAAIDLDGPLDALRLAWNASFSDWRADPTVERAKLTSLTLQAGGAELPALLDGERFALPAKVSVRLVRGAFNALIPAGDGSKGGSAV